MTPLRIFIGYDSREPLAYHVLCHSILTRASVPVSITPLVQPALRKAGIYTRRRTPTESTEFSLTRFLVPYLSGYEEMSVFMDCDILCQADINQLVADVDTTAAVWVCPHDYLPRTSTKMEHQPQTNYPRKNWSSVMVFNNTKCTQLTQDYVNTATGLELQRFQWVPDQLMSYLPLAWNWLVGEYEPNPYAHLFHYTLGGPWYRDYQFCDHADLWFRELDAAFPTLNLPKPVGV